MKRNQSAFRFMTQTMVVFAYTMVILNLLALVVGEEAKSVSTIFSMGSSGISAITTFQFLLSSVVLTGLRAFIFGDRPKIQMPLWGRCICMLATSLPLLAGFILVFDWFPADEIKYWILFLSCYLISCAGSVVVTVMKEKSENSRMEKALKKYQRGEDT